MATCWGERSEPCHVIEGCGLLYAQITQRALERGPCRPINLQCRIKAELGVTERVRGSQEQIGGRLASVRINCLILHSNVVKRKRLLSDGEVAG